MNEAFFQMDMGLNRLLFVLTMALVIFSEALVFAGDQESLPVGEFSQHKLDDWGSKKFVNETEYSLALLDGNTALKAVSRNSASGLIRKIRVDIEKYPFLNWKWRIENRLDGSFDEKQKPGDDYAARIYVVVSGGIAVWNTRALNYVWAKNSLKGDVWPNAFARNNAIMKALRSSEAPVTNWLSEKRNIYTDFKQLFGKEVRFIDAVVVMSDTDNTRNSVTAYYGDIYFSTQ